MTDINFTTILLGTIIAVFIGSFIHLIFGGKFIRLLVSIIFSTIGFWTGNHLGNRYALSFFVVGNLHIIISSLTSLGFGSLGYWISGESR